jgi:hypothetical protein
MRSMRMLSGYALACEARGKRREDGRIKTRARMAEHESIQI